MSQAQTLIAELDAALTAASPDWRLSALRQVTALFVAAAPGYSDEHIAVYDAVMMRLIDTMAPPALAELSRQLATVVNAPPDTVARLARHDNIAVAGPVLEQSNAVTDTALAEVAKAKGPDHLLAIAGRATITTLVSDILIDRGIEQVMQRIVANQGASISEVGFVKLINVAKRDKSLSAQIAGRTDVPDELRSFLSLAM